MNATASTETAPKSANKGGRPPNPPSEKDIARVLASDAGRAAISAAAQDAVAQILSTMQHVRSEAATGEPAAAGAINPADRSFAEQLALSFAQLADQGAGKARMRVAPEEMAKRRAAREDLLKKLASVKALGLRPTYRVIAKTYLEEVFVEPFRLDPVSKATLPVEIFWNGVPNECMRPMDESAREVYELYLRSTGGLTSLVQSADKRGMSITPGGLVIKGDSNPRRTVGNLADSSHGAPRDAFGLEIITQFNPNAKEVNVLGTIHPPARQNSHQTSPAQVGA